MVHGLKPNLHPRGPVSSKTLQSTITAADTKVTGVALAQALILQAINALCDEESGHTRPFSLCKLLQKIDCEYCVGL